MTSERFEELVNLYLDNEIGCHELEELKRVLKENVMLRRQFERSCQVHQAARKALVSRDPAAGSGSGGDSSTRYSTGHDETRSRPSRPDAEPVSLKTSQRMAHVNASIPVLAERQMSKGAASIVDMGKSARQRSGGSSSGGGSSRGGHSSGGGLAGAAGSSTSLWLGLCILGFATLSILFYFSGYADKFGLGNPYAISGPDPDAAPLVTDAQKQEIINKILPGYTPGAEWKPAKAEDAFRDRLYNNEIGAGSVTRSMQLNYSESETAPGASGGIQSSIWSMHVSEQMLVAPVNITINTPEPSQMNLSTRTPLISPATSQPLVPVPSSVVPDPQNQSAPNSSSPASNPVTPWVP